MLDLHLVVLVIPHGQFKISIEQDIELVTLLDFQMMLGYVRSLMQYS